MQRIVEPPVPATREAERSYGGLRCADLMTTDVTVLGTGETAVAAASKMRDHNVGFLPVCSSDRKLLGVLTDRDLTLRVIAEERPLHTAVQDVMSVDPVVCPASAELELAEGLMRAHRKERMPCVDEDGRLVGVLSLADVARYTSSERAGDLLGEVVEREIAGRRDEGDEGG